MELRERLDLRRFFAGEKAVEGPIVLNQRRVFIIPNRRGFGLGILLLIQFLAAINYSNNLSFILTFLLGSIALLGILYCFRNLAGLSIRTGRSEPVFAGEAAEFNLYLDNPSSTPRIGVHIGLRHGPAQELNLPAGESRRVTLTVETNRRGWLDLPTITLFGTFPLGLFRAWSPLNLKQRALVYPRPASDHLPFPEAPGEVGSRSRTHEGDFHGFQTYQPGDPLRRIHWKGVAKGQGVHVKEYRGEEGILLYLDWSQTPGFDSEARLSRLCRWALDAERAGMNYGLRLPGTDIKPATGPAQLKLCLEKLALFGL
ncbi:MAG: DUF58 domain-containing protein [Methylococcaceae bacterium]|nr:DUF58 domain-containing protein [Methylococcaceae bacterium]